MAAAGTAARRVALPVGALLASKLVALLAPLLALWLILAVLFGAPAPDRGAGELRYGASAFALRDIPRSYLRLYQRAGESGIDWAVLAGIGKVETNHGRLHAPGVTGGVNAFGCCGGPMQFWIAPPHPNTWDSYGVDGNHDGTTDPHDPADAIPAAANYLRASGAPGDYRTAVFAYNHASWYVDEVLGYAERYRGPLRGTDAPTVPGPRATLDELGIAHAPADAPAAVARMIAAGNKIGNRPYLYGGGHPDFLAAWALDCSSSTSYLLHQAGLIGHSALVSGELMTWGKPGPGGWVTIYASPDHVFSEIAGLRNDTGRYDTGPNAGESGPRWRLGERPTPGFVVRHPSGL